VLLLNLLPGVGYSCCRQSSDVGWLRGKASIQPVKISASKHLVRRQLIPVGELQLKVASGQPNLPPSKEFWSVL